LGDSQLEPLLGPRNPWWHSAGQWEGLLPDFERPVVGQIPADLDELPQMVSVTGPRRVGKSTAVRQVVSRLIRQKGIVPERIVYFSLDDPEIAASETRSSRRGGR
jgi:predicted AAA+ superfamily ATPase